MIEQGVKDVYSSESFKQYLSCLSKFHSYSLNNTLLILSQKPEASLVAGYRAWQTNFNRHVNKGEKGLTILAPVTTKEDRLMNKHDENGNVIETKNPVLLRKTVSTETSELVKTYLQAVMQYGTGKRAQVEGYDIGAKTGTAQKLPRKDGKYLLSYIGYAPQENPEVVIYVVIDEANVDAQDNSSLVLELAKNIMSEAFPYLGITTIEEAGESQTQQSGQSFEDTEYSDYDQDYTDDYSNEDGSYVDENYKPDLDSWATSSNID